MPQQLMPRMDLIQALDALAERTANTEDAEAIRTAAIIMKADDDSDRLRGQVQQVLNRLQDCLKFAQTMYPQLTLEQLFGIHPVFGLMGVMGSALAMGLPEWTPEQQEAYALALAKLDTVLELIKDGISMSRTDGGPVQ